MSKKALTHKDVKNLKKTVEDQTFGMKNKKNSKQAEKLVQSMANTRGGMEKFVAEQFAKKQAKKEEEEEKRLAAELYGQGIAASARVAKKEDEDDGKPKVCPFFKAGVCDKGRKCKLSHELDKEEAVLNIYMDPRDQKKAEGDDAVDDKDTIKNWDTKKLEEVVNYNEKKYDNTNKPTEIVCKHFLEAIEKRIYGWFWVCPNGGFKCQYRHALPQGYILKRDMEALKKGEDEDETRIEDLIDSEIYNLDKKKLTPVTHERFLDWKKKRMERKQKEQDEKLKADLIKAGHKTKLKSVMSGKSLFVYQPTYALVLTQIVRG